MASWLWRSLFSVTKACIFWCSASKLSSAGRGGHQESRKMSHHYTLSMRCLQKFQPHSQTTFTFSLGTRLQRPLDAYMDNSSCVKTHSLLWGEQEENGKASSRQNLNLSSHRTTTNGQPPILTILSLCLHKWRWMIPGNYQLSLSFPLPPQQTSWCKMLKNQGSH